MRIDPAKVLAEAAAMVLRGDPCRDYWSWYGAGGRECELPFGHTGSHQAGGIGWGR